MKEIRLIQYDSPEYRQQVQLRFDVLRAPLGLQFTDEFLQKDRLDLMFGYFEESEILGCCQLSDIGNHIFQLRQMAVSPKMQGKNLGKKLVTFVEDYVQRKGAKKIVLHAREVARGFYEKIGYHIQGEKFLEVGIPHYNMEKEL